MTYFILKEDERELNPMKVNLEQADLETEEGCVVFTEFKKHTTFIDYFQTKKLFDYQFFVSDRLKELLDIYGDNITATPVIITDKNKEEQEVYWKMEVPVQDPSRVKGKYIFRVRHDKQEYIVVSLHLAENILRKNFSGIKFERI